MSKPVGFDQKLELRYLDITVNEAKATDRKDMYAKLDEALKAYIKGQKSRQNAITMLMKIWYPVEEEYKLLLKRAIELYDNLPEPDRIVLHWCMTILAYPFFKDVAEEMGNLLKLQKEVPSSQLTRRIKLLYGDRRRIEVAIGAVLSTLKSWGIVRLERKQFYTLSRKITIDNINLKNWLLEIILRSTQYKTLPLNMIPSLAMLFPFEFNIGINEINVETVRIDRQGLDTYMLSAI